MFASYALNQKFAILNNPFSLRNYSRYNFVIKSLQKRNSDKRRSSKLQDL